MTIDEIIKKLFDYNEKIEKGKYYHLLKDDVFCRYLESQFSDVYDFVKECTIVYTNAVKIAAISVKSEERPILYLNPHRITYLMKEIAIQNHALAFETMACILWHETLHVILYHFRLPGEAYKREYVNIAQDMFIDNLIHQKIKEWRNWEKVINEINQKLKEKGEKSTHKPISLDSSEPNNILNLTDIHIYSYLEEIELDKKYDKDMHFDVHPWVGEDISDSDKTDSGEEGQEGEKGEEWQEGDKEGNNIDDLINKIAAKASQRVEESNDNPFSKLNGNLSGDKILKCVAEGEKHDLFSILRKFLKPVYTKSTVLTWKRKNKRMPGLKPGNRKFNRFGEILLLIDTSYSMNNFLANYARNVFYDLYILLKKVAKVYGAQGKIYKGDIDSEVKNIIYLDKVENLREINLYGGGSTDYREVFDTILTKWNRIECNNLEKRPKQKYPDFVIFISDFEVDFDFLKEPKYARIGKRLIWIYTDVSKNILKPPPIGIIVPMIYNDYYTNEKRKGGYFYGKPITNR